MLCFKKKEKKKKNPVCLNFRRPLPSVGTLPNSPRSAAREGSWEANRQLLPPSPVLLSTWDAAGQAAKPAHQPEPKPPLLRGGPAPTDWDSPCKRGCEMLNFGASGVQPWRISPPRRLPSALPYKLAVAGNPQKSARKGRGQLGGQQLKIGLPGRQPWRSRSICK